MIARDIALTSNSRTFEAVGTGRARLSVQIFPAVSDEVVEVLFQAQQKVPKGGVLVRLDDREEKLAVQNAEVALKDAKSLMERYESAVKEGAVPQSEVDSARAKYEMAQVALDQAKLDLEEHEIKAPFDGVVGIPNVDPGDRVDPQTLITSLDDRKILHADFHVPEALVKSLNDKANLTITATTPAYPSRTFTGTITAQESRVNPATRTLLVRANIENEEDLLRPGMSFNIRWNIQGSDYPTVPEISVQWGRDGAYVWIVKDNAAVKVPVRVVARNAGVVLVEGELAGGDDVVVEGVQRLRPGARVEVLGESAE